MAEAGGRVGEGIGAIVVSVIGGAMLVLVWEILVSLVRGSTVSDAVGLADSVTVVALMVFVGDPALGLNVGAVVASRVVGTVEATGVVIGSIDQKISHLNHL